MTPGNRYQPTEAELADAEPVGDVARGAVLLIIAVIQAVVALLIAAIATSVVGEFKAMFDGFGAEMSAATRFIVSNSWIWWLFGVAGLAIGVWVAARPRVTSREVRRMKLALRTFLIVFGVAIAFAVYSLYASLFELGRPV